jgi:Arc/MetJ-type ribon-helix-helix transcriptional regulator
MMGAAKKNGARERAGCSSVYRNVTIRSGDIDKPIGMTYRNTERFAMPKAKVAISLDQQTLERLDQLVRNKTFTNRSQAIEAAVEEKLQRLNRVRLAQECKKLDPASEKELAEEGFSEELSRWPEY